jgi:hypothetical protein
VDAISQARLHTVIPELQRRVTRLDSLLMASPLAVHLRITRAIATFSEQAAIYAEGRTSAGVPCIHNGITMVLGTCKIHPMGSIVTNAKPMNSMHIYGLAVDACPDLPGLPTWRPDWDEKDARWQEFLSLARTCNLAEGAQWRTFKDFPHLYLIELPADPDDNLRQLLTDGGVQAVWDWANKTCGFQEGSC